MIWNRAWKQLFVPYIWTFQIKFSTSSAFGARYYKIAVFTLIRHLHYMLSSSYRFKDRELDNNNNNQRNKFNITRKLKPKINIKGDRKAKVKSKLNAENEEKTKTIVHGRVALIVR